MPRTLLREEVAPGAMLMAGAVADPDDPHVFRLVVASLATSRKVAEADLDRVLADAPPGLVLRVTIPYEYVLDRLPELPLISGRKEDET